MQYGVKVIHTHTVGADEYRIYEELILLVNADSFDEAYEKAGRYMHDSICGYVNTNGEVVKTLSIEAIDCFLACEPEADVQEIYSSFSANHTSLSEAEYYTMITDSCDEKELFSLRNKEFN